MIVICYRGIKKVGRRRGYIQEALGPRAWMERGPNRDNKLDLIR